MKHRQQQMLLLVIWIILEAVPLENRPRAELAIHRSSRTPELDPGPCVIIHVVLYLVIINSTVAARAKG